MLVKNANNKTFLERREQWQTRYMMKPEEHF